MTELIIYPQEFGLFFKILLIPFLFEFVRIFLVYWLAGQSSQLTKLEKDKVATQYELSQIKSVQLELVRNSKLERTLIKIEKEIEKLKANQQPKEKKMKYYSQIIRVVVYLVAGLYFSTVPIVLISPKIFWPFGWIFFTSSETIALHAWFLVFLAGGSFRHLLRSILLLFAPASTFP